MRVYLAGPFFNQGQGQVIRDVEAILVDLHISHFSPSRDQPQFSPNVDIIAKRQAAGRIYATNIVELNMCTHVLACIDDFDPGTIFEMGYARGLPDRKTIIAFTTQGHGLNMMLSQACDGFAKDLMELKSYLTGSHPLGAWTGKLV